MLYYSSKQKSSASHLPMLGRVRSLTRNYNVLCFVDGPRVRPLFYYIKEMFTIKNDMIINEGIRAPQIRLIGSDGSQRGIVDNAQAKRFADDEDLDLVLIAPTAKPPVAKIMDYGKHRFEQAKQAKEMKKKQSIIEIKGIRLSATIEEHDVATRAKQAVKFLKAGNKLKVSIRFKGRQMAHTKNGIDVMNNFAKRVEEYAVIEQRPKLDGRFMTMTMAPKSK